MAEMENTGELLYITKFYKHHDCSDLMESLKEKTEVLCINTEFPIWKTCEVILKNGVQGTPLWHTEKKLFLGITTTSDFIKILHIMRSSPFLENLMNQRTETWFEFLKVTIEPFLAINPSSSLLEAMNLLISNEIYQLPVIKEDTGEIINIITHQKILKFLFRYLNQLPNSSIMELKLCELQINTIALIQPCTEEASIFEAIPRFMNNRISILPIVNSENRLIDLCSQFDIINMLTKVTETYYHIKIKNIFENRAKAVNRWLTCYLTDSLYAIMEKFVKTEVPHLIIVDETDRVIGDLFLSDLLFYVQYRFPLKNTNCGPSK